MKIIPIKQHNITIHLKLKDLLTLEDFRFGRMSLLYQMTATDQVSPV